MKSKPRFNNGAALIASSGGLEKGEETFGSCFSMSYKYKVLGGDPNIWLQPKEGDELQQLWADSINDTNLHPTDYRLRPIWELLEHDSMDPAKAIELEAFMLARWEEAGGDGSDEKFPFAEDKRMKKPTGTVTIYQPAEENRDYDSRIVSKEACNLIGAYNGNSKQGCWDVTDLSCKNGELCLKTGLAKKQCYAGRISLPEGVTVDTYIISGNWDNACTKGERVNTYKGPITEEDFWNQWTRVCVFRFTASEGYSCDDNPGCTI